MGIPGLCKFMEDNFTKWKKPNFGEWSHVIVDGNNIRGKLYLFSWKLGGEYQKFGAEVEEFFRQLKSLIETPIVVFDHGKREHLTADKVRDRRSKSFRKLKKLQDQPGWCPQDTSQFGPHPPLIRTTFLDVLKKMDIEIRFANGYADREMVTLANHYKCPALSADSDFFMFNLEYGFIYLERYFNNPYSNSLYYVHEFQQQFGISNYELCLIIPAALSPANSATTTSAALTAVTTTLATTSINPTNPTTPAVTPVTTTPVTTTPTTPVVTLATTPVTTTPVTTNPATTTPTTPAITTPVVASATAPATTPAAKPHVTIEEVLEDIKHFDTPEQYLESGNAKARFEDYAKAKCWYFDLPQLEQKHNWTFFPLWAVDSFRRGCFPPLSLLMAYRNETNILFSIVDNVQFESAWLISQSIRQHIYGLLDVPADSTVKEAMRAAGTTELTDFPVPPLFLNSMEGAKPPAILDDFFQDKQSVKLKNIVLDVLNCHSLFEETVSVSPPLDKWELPIAATFYWYQKLDSGHYPSPTKQKLLKSLLLSFLSCSGLKRLNIPRLRITPLTREAHLLALHAFSQWQCVYLDALNLNYLAREPLAYRSPAELYSGEVAMHYALLALVKKTTNEKWMEDVVGVDTPEWDLTNRFLCQITGQGER